MANVAISGDTSGAITLSAPAVAGTNTITLPASTGTMVTTGSPQSGSVIQVVSAIYSTLVSLTNSTFTDTGLTATITPKFSTSKILVLVGLNGVSKVSAATYANIQLQRNGSLILQVEGVGSTATTTNNRGFGVPMYYLDAPATTSATVYKTQGQNANGTGTVYFQDYSASGTYSCMTLLEIAA